MAAILTGLLGSGAMVFQGTQSAFTAQTSNTGNNWTTGSIALADDDSSGAMFNLTTMIPGDTGTKCIQVQYTGNVATNIKMYVSAITDANGLGSYVDLVVTRGDGGTFSSCTGFVADATGTFQTSTLAAFQTASNAWTNGVGSWTPSANANKTYKIQWTLNAATPNTMQGKTVSATFQWEARS